MKRLRAGMPGRHILLLPTHHIRAIARQDLSQCRQISAHCCMTGSEPPSDSQLVAQWRQTSAQTPQTVPWWSEALSMKAALAWQMSPQSRSTVM